MLDGMEAGDRISGEDLLGRLAPGGPWTRIVCLAVADSTNDRAMEMAAGGAPHGTVVVAEAQTSGRGRQGRTWVSPPGRNIYVSLLLRPAIPVPEAPRLSLVAGVALAEAVEGAGVPCFLKWPNDLYVAGRKAAGILAEMASDAGRVRHVVVGVGINVNMPANEIPARLRGRATSLAIHAKRVLPRVEVLARFLDAFAARYRDFLAGGFPAVRPGWERRDFLRGKPILLRKDGAERWGTADGLDEAGALRFLPDGGTAAESVHSGEILEFRR